MLFLRFLYLYFRLLELPNFEFDFLHKCSNPFSCGQAAWYVKLLRSTPRKYLCIWCPFVYFLINAEVHWGRVRVVSFTWIVLSNMIRHSLYALYKLYITSKISLKFRSKNIIYVQMHEYNWCSGAWISLMLRRINASRYKKLILQEKNLLVMGVFKFWPMLKNLINCNGTLHYSYLLT